MAALIFVGEQISVRLLDFLRHWYISSFYNFSHSTLALLEKLDRRFALKINLKHLFVPLYQDRSVMGYGLGFILRGAKVSLASVLYLAVLLLSALAYLIWLVIPIFLTYRIFNFWPR